MFRDNDSIESGGAGPERRESFQFHARQPGFTLKTKLMIGAFIAGSIALGTVLFLFFMTLFIYVFLPVTAVLLVWNFLRRALRR